MAELGGTPSADTFGFFDPDQIPYPEEHMGTTADLAVRYGGTFIHRADYQNPEGFYSTSESRPKDPLEESPNIDFNPEYAEPVVDIDQQLRFAITHKIALKKGSLPPATLSRLMRELEPRHLVYTTPRHGTPQGEAYGININAVPEVLARVEAALTHLPPGGRYPASALVLDIGTRGDFRDLFARAIQPPAPNRTPPILPTPQPYAREVEPATTHVGTAAATPGPVAAKPAVVQNPAPATTEQQDQGLADQKLFRRGALAAALVSSGLTGMVIEGALQGNSATQNTIGGVACTFAWGATGVLHYFSKRW